MKSKRSCGGYVMIYVMVVIAIISAMSLSVSSISLRNLQAQEASIRQLKDTYAAEGMVEMFCEWLKIFPFENTSTIENVSELNKAWKDCKIGSLGEIEVTAVTPVTSGDPGEYNISITATAYATEYNPTDPPSDPDYGTMQVDAVLNVTTETESGTNIVKVTGIEYTSYTVSPAEKTEVVEPGGGAE